MSAKIEKKTTPSGIVVEARIPYSWRKLSMIRIELNDADRVLDLGYYVEEIFDAGQYGQLSERFAEIITKAEKVKTVRGVMRLLRLLYDLTDSMTVLTAYKIARTLKEAKASVTSSHNGLDTITLYYSEGNRSVVIDIIVDVIGSVTVWYGVHVLTVLSEDEYTTLKDQLDRAKDVDDVTELLYKISELNR